MGAAEIPPWFNDAIVTGMQTIQVLSLPGTPPEETIGFACDVWVRTLWDACAWEPADTARISAAFLVLARYADRWPAPRHVLEHLPPRPEPLKLDAPQPTAEQRARMRVRLQKLAKDLREKWTEKMRAAETQREAAAAAAAEARRVECPPSETVE